MIKGVSKQVLEVTNPENPYFEKIVFFVKPQYENEDRNVLEREAKALSKKAKRPPKTRRTKKDIMRIIFATSLCALAGIAMTFLVNTFI